MNKRYALLLLIALIIAGCNDKQHRDISPPISDEEFCKQEFDNVINALKKMSDEHPIMVGFAEHAVVDEEFSEREGGMYHLLHYTVNYRSSKLKKDPPSGPYVNLCFILRTGHYSEAAVVMSLEGYEEYKKTELKTGKLRHVPYSHRSKALTISASAVSDDDELVDKIYKLFDAVAARILERDRDKR